MIGSLSPLSWQFEYMGISEYVFCIHYGTIVWDNTGTTPNTVYMKTVNKKNAHNYVCYLTHGRLGAQK